MFSAMKKFLITALVTFSLPALCQTVQNSGYGTVGYVKSDGAIQNASYSIIGHIKNDGTVQNVV
jgi:hypothetical protein